MHLVRSVTAALILSLTVDSYADAPAHRSPPLLNENSRETGVATDIPRTIPPDNSVFVREPMVRLVRPMDIPAACGKGANVEACTAFVGQAMECSCALSGSGWHVRTGARFIPVMYVTGPRWVAHEREHIEDIQSRVEAHLRAVEGRTFTSASQCESFAAAERAAFPRLMDEYKRESNRMMHGSERDTAR